MAEDLEKNLDEDLDKDLDKDLNLDAFDLDLDDDAGIGGGDLDDEEQPKVPKSRVAKLVKKRLAKERDKQRKFAEDFKKVYGMSPEEAVTFGMTELRKQQGLQAQPAAPQTLPQQPAVPVQTTADPTFQKLNELDAQLRRMQEERQREREALEFVQAYPNVKFTDIPREVLDRRARGGVTLAEAYKLYFADQLANDAARNAAESATRNAKARNYATTEGADFSGGVEDTSNVLTAEERMFAQSYGMSPKEYLTFKMKVKKSKEGV